MKTKMVLMTIVVLSLCFGVSAQINKKSEKLMILQANIAGNSSDGFPNSLVELYNNTDEAINLNDDNYYLHIGDDSEWTKIIKLTGKIPAKASYLVVSATDLNSTPRLSLPAADQEEDFSFTNNAVLVALLRNRSDFLAFENPFLDNNLSSDYVDMLGAGSNITIFETAGAQQSRPQPPRRTSLADTDNNSTDFSRYDARGNNISDEELAKYWPRNSAFGAWNPFEGLEIELPFTPPKIIVSQNGLPVIEIWTHDESGITSKEEFNKLKYFSLTDPNNSANNFVRNGLSSKDEIRGRGNATWVADRKDNPYRIRFSGDVSLFQLPARRNWVLLHTAGSAINNSFGFEMGQRLGLQYTCSYNPVEVYLNGEFLNTYLLTEHRQADPRVEGAPGRPKVHLTEGWFVEIDRRFDELPRFRTTNYNLPVMPKSPEFGNEINDSRYDFVRNEWKELTDLMASANFPENGYRNLIDMETFVKYFLVQTFIQNCDLFRYGAETGIEIGSTFFYRDKDGKISAGPLWDMDWSFVDDVNNMFGIFSPTLHPYQVHPWFSRFFDDPVFLARYKEIWNENIQKIETMREFIDHIHNRVGGLNSLNDSRNYMKNFFDKRIDFLNREYNKVNVLPASKNFGTVFENYTEITPQTFTFVAFGEINELKVNFKNTNLSDFEIIAEIGYKPTGTGGYLVTVNVKPKNALSLNSLPTKKYSDVLTLSGKNQGNDFTLEVPLSFTLNCNHSWVNATYENPKTCSICGITEGEKLTQTSIGKKEKSRRFGIKFAQNPTADNAEILVNVEFGIRNVELKIYDMTGNVVFDRRGVLHTPANNAFIWDLRNNAGRKVANGTYLVVAEIIGTNGKRYSYSAKLGVKR